MEPMQKKLLKSLLLFYYSKTILKVLSLPFLQIQAINIFLRNEFIKMATTITDILKFKQTGEKFSVLTAYNFQTAKILDKAQVPVLLVGDSLAMVELGYDSTLPVTVDEMIHHTKAVVRGAKNALVICDMPFMSYQVCPEEALINAGRIIKETGCGAVKLEGGVRCFETIELITSAGIPVMGHVGLTPQSVNQFGGYKIQGKKKNDKVSIVEDAISLEEAGAFAVVLECVPQDLAKEITETLTIPTIGIGAGPYCDGQVLVTNDMLGMESSTSRQPKFLRRYSDLNTVITKAVNNFMKDVKNRKYPNDDESY